MEYANQADRSHTTLVEAFRNMHVDEEELLENGDANLEVCAVSKLRITLKVKSSVLVPAYLKGLNWWHLILYLLLVILILLAS